MKCNICGSIKWTEDRTKGPIKCRACGSKPRQRACLLLIDKLLTLNNGSKVLHFAPERGLGSALMDRVGRPGYDGADLDPTDVAKRTGLPVRRFDLCRDTFGIPESSYDLILHNHVLEHIPCNYSQVLSQLRAALKPGGYHIFTTPILKGYYREDLNPALSPGERKAHFSQSDHVRRFGIEDFNETLGLAIGVTKSYSLLQFARPEELRDINVPPELWEGVNGSSPFVIRA